MPKCLVLGANGFIGSHLVDQLVDAGYEVRAFGRFRKEEAIFLPNSAIEIFSGDYLNKADLKEALSGVDLVFHLVSSTTPAISEDNPLIDIDTNVRMSVELLNLCVENKVKRVIYASSGGAIYSGDQESFSEIDSTSPLSPYAIGKLTVENYLRYFYVKHKLDYTIFRISNPYGERQPFWNKQGVIPIFIERVCRNEPITVFGDGSMIRDYIYIKDLARMIVATLGVNPKHHIYNLGSGKGYSVKEVIEAIKKVVKKDIKIDTKPVPSTYVSKSVLNTSRFTEEFLIKPKVTLEEGVALTYEFIQAKLKQKKE